MKKANNTKQTLVMSVLSLVLCMSMLIGTTFAWFTDSAVSSNNIIKAGNLDLEVEWAKATDAEGNVLTESELAWNTLEENSELFDNDGLWEPGYAQAVYLKVKNNGSLAYKYTAGTLILDEKTGVSVLGNTIKLSDILMVDMEQSARLSLYEDREDVCTDEWGQFVGKAYHKSLAEMTDDEGVMLPGDVMYVKLGIYMPTTVGNEANYRGEAPQIQLGVVFTATQYTHESDAFGNQYDVKAEYPVVKPDAYANTNESLKDAILAGDVNSDEEIVVQLSEGTFIIPDEAKGKNLVIKGSGANTKIATQDDGSYEGCDYSLDGATVTFENISINTDSRTYTGYARLNATYNNCVINGTYTLYGESVFNNCTFNVSGDVYNIWTWGAPVATFNNCTFNSDGKALLLYGQANTKLTVDGCTFNDNGALADLKAAIEIGNDYNKSYTLIVNDTTVNGYEINDKGIVTGTTLWANKNSMPTDKLNVIVDGVDVY